MIKKIGIGLATVIAVLFIYVAFQSPNYIITRDILIAAPPGKIFPHMNNQKLAEKWGPWLEVDPQAKMNYSGPDEGVGAKASWDSSGDLGTGSATIVTSVANSSVGIDLVYTKPMEMRQHSEYLLEPEGAQTKVTWRVAGTNNFIGRLMCTFMNMDRHVGGMFEKGLSNLKKVVETTP